VASRVNRCASGRPKNFSEDIDAEIIDAWDESDTRTYSDVAKQIGLPRSTLRRYSTKDMDLRMLRPMGGATICNQEGKEGRWFQARPCRCIVHAAACAARNLAFWTCLFSVEDPYQRDPYT